VYVHYAAAHAAACLPSQRLLLTVVHAEGVRAHLFFHIAFKVRSLHLLGVQDPYGFTLALTCP
jgi:hypothetical protein